jgi:small-conductance mechanosensitive channel
LDSITDALSRAAAQIADSAPALLAALAVFGLFLLVGHTAAGVATRMIEKAGRQNRYATLIRKGVRWGFTLIGIVLALQLLGLTAVATSLLATGGLFAVILGFAFREIGENILAGILLGVSRSFEVGDLIEVSGYVGEVREIDLRQVWLRAADGRDIFVPSGEIVRNVLINFTRDGLRRGEFVIGIDYADPVMEARTLLLDVARGVEGVLDDPGPAVRLNEFEQDYCELKVFFWVDIDGGTGLAELRSRLMGASLRALREGRYTLSSDVTASVAIVDDEDESA